MNIPPLMYGTAWKQEHTAEWVEKAVLSGFRGIDTACQPKHYNEAGVGMALRRLSQQGIAREALFVQTKFTPLSGQDPKRIPYDPYQSLEIQVAQSFEASQKNLQTDYVDSLVLHSPLFPYSKLLEVWLAMEAIYHRGGACQLGISNCYDIDVLKRLHEDSEIKPTIVQNRFYDQSGYDVEIRQWCQNVGSTYQSFWTLTANPHLLSSRIFFALTQEYDKSEAQILYRYLTQSGVVPLIGSTSMEHLIEDLSIFDFTLTSEELIVISSLLER